MKPDAWLPYYGSDFEQATKGWRREVKWSYLAALWHYWSHTHTEGLPDDDDQLRLICDCQEQDWARTKGMIFRGEPFFVLTDGFWQQSRSRKEWVVAIGTYQKRLSASRAGVAARMVPPSVEPMVQPSVEPMVQPSVEHSVNQSQSQSQEVQGSPTPSAEIQTLKEAIDRTMTVGIPEDFVKFVYEDWSSRAGRDAGGVVVSWLGYVTKRWSREQVEWKNKTHKGKRDGNNPQNYSLAGKPTNSVFNLTKIIEAKKTRANEVFNQHATETGLTTTWANERARLEYRELKAEIKRLTIQISKLPT